MKKTVLHIFKRCRKSVEDNRINHLSHLLIVHKLDDTLHE